MVCMNWNVINSIAIGTYTQFLIEGVITLNGLPISIKHGHHCIEESTALCHF